MWTRFSIPVLVLLEGGSAHSVHQLHRMARTRGFAAPLARKGRVRPWYKLLDTKLLRANLALTDLDCGVPCSTMVALGEGLREALKRLPSHELEFPASLLTQLLGGNLLDDFAHAVMTLNGVGGRGFTDLLQNFASLLTSEEHPSGRLQGTRPLFDQSLNDALADVLREFMNGTSPRQGEDTVADNAIPKTDPEASARSTKNQKDLNNWDSTDDASSITADQEDLDSTGDDY